MKIEVESKGMLVMVFEEDIGMVVWAFGRHKLKTSSVCARGSRFKECKGLMWQNVEVDFDMYVRARGSEKGEGGEERGCNACSQSFHQPPEVQQDPMAQIPFQLGDIESEQSVKSRQRQSSKTSWVTETNLCRFCLGCGQIVKLWTEANPQEKVHTSERNFQQ